MQNNKIKNISTLFAILLCFPFYGLGTSRSILWNKNLDSLMWDECIFWVCIFFLMENLLYIWYFILNVKQLFFLTFVVSFWYVTHRPHVVYSAVWLFCSCKLECFAIISLKFTKCARGKQPLWIISINECKLI